MCVFHVTGRLTVLPQGFVWWNEDALVDITIRMADFSTAAELVPQARPGNVHAKCCCV